MYSVASLWKLVDSELGIVEGNFGQDYYGFFPNLSIQIQIDAHGAVVHRWRKGGQTKGKMHWNKGGQWIVRDEL